MSDTTISPQAVPSKEVLLRLNNALDELFEHDLCLLRVDSSERSICGALAAHLHSAFHGYDVDVEYNRIGEDQVKKMGLTQPDGHDKDTSVYPDIIIHRRTTNDNLLVIEVKKGKSAKSTQYQAAKKFDLYKLDRYKQVLHYQEAIFVEFPTGALAERGGVVLIEC